MMTEQTELPTADAPPYQPTLRDLFQLELPVNACVAPGGQRVAILVRTTNWQTNRYEIVCQIHDLTSGAHHPLTRRGTVQQVEWLDATTVALLKQGPGEEAKAQIWLYEGLIGEGWPVTDHELGVEWFKPFADGFLFRARQPERDKKQARTDRFGNFIHLEQEISAAALYYVDLAAMRQHQAQLKAVTEAEAKTLVAPVVEVSRLLPAPLSIQSVVPSPRGDAIYLNCQQRDDLVYFHTTSTYCIHFDAQTALAAYRARAQAKLAASSTSTDTAGKNSTGEGEDEGEDWAYLGGLQQLHLPLGATVAAVAPDGNTLAVRHRARDEKMYTYQDLWLIDEKEAVVAPDAATFFAALHNISAALDQRVLDLYWVAQGIFVSYAEGTGLRLAQLHEDGQVAPLELGGLFPVGGFHMAASGHLALVATNASTFPEAYFAPPPTTGSSVPLQLLTNFGQAVERWDLGTVETIRWRSKDGVEIEGVLRKPRDFDPTQPYPLVFVVHGGPQGISTAYLLSHEDLAYYPTLQFINKGVLVLKPNYRGSLGYGQAFADLNVNNLGIGDLWDVESAIDHLADLGWVDRERIGCMGWSQGGYISAFAALHSDQFKAASVGAGISDWYTYHISNDIPHFTLDYLSASPFHNREPYRQTAPISNLANAKTPTLIQHGADDRRVPLANAMELYRGLQAMGVPVELFVFPGMGHPITRPRENHAVMHQNLAWFSHYLLGEELNLE